MSTEENLECIVCERPLRGDVFMGIKINEEFVRICCPICSETFDKSRSFYISRRIANESLSRLKENQKGREDT
jgi:hypothetical protein